MRECTDDAKAPRHARGGGSWLDPCRAGPKTAGLPPVRSAALHVATNTADRLTLEARPWLLGVILTAAILVMLLIGLANLADEPGLGLGMFLGAGLFGLCFTVFVRRVIVIFDRTAGAVVIRTASVLGQTEKTLPLSDIRGAEVETSISTSSSGGRSHTHRPVLRLTGQTEPFPLTQVYSSGAGAEFVVQAVNRWLGGGETGT